MILPRISIQRPILAWMMNLVLVLFGLIGLSRLPVRELPDIDPPIVSVTTVFPGANAQVVETEVTERLEEAINNIEGIKTLRSESREGVSNISVEFDLSRDIDSSAQDVRDRVSRVRGALPRDIREPIVSKQDSDAQPILWIALNSERYSPLEMTTLAEKQIKPRFQGVTGVSSITIGGEKRYAMRLWLDSARMAARRVTVLDVQQALRQQNIELPSGRVENLDREMTIQTRGEMKSAEEFNNLVLRAEGANLVRLKDVGRAEDGVSDYRTIARASGKPCIFLGIVKQAKANTVNVAQSIRAEMKAIEPTLPEGVKMWVNYDSSIYVEKAISEVWDTLAIAFGLVVLIIFVFLRDLRATVIPTVAIPVSIIGTFAVLHLMGYSVNILTMLALVLVIGISVNGSRRWLGYGSIRFQVSEFAKLGLVFCLAHYLALNQTRIAEFKRGFLYPGGIIGAFALLTLLEPDFGVSALMVAVGMVLMFLAGARWRYIVPAFVGVTAVFTIAVIQNPNRLRRMTEFLSEEKSYQLRQGLAAFAAGGVEGAGLGQGRQQLSYLPEAHTDYIFSVVGEELGLFFTLAVVLCFTVILIAGLVHLRRAPSLFHFLLVLGSLLLICVQAIINVGVVTAVLPTKGMSLPFISAGLSNLLLMGLLLGIILNSQRRWGRAGLPAGAGAMREVRA